ncbi:Gfo/Idh/MocA family protein [Dermatobacter hominis]|uniref:Gfo/Idh/MocA family protein n=1 Tax=Dermatobacter hominis TaxID=2884263 RepID=UPI001D0FE6B6|nr:Gfo/Idh/MocA family oxidoreductase [Dermatobacter hominis]UDY35905.1 Gfo/Idh/MocA family oxidoreductase [Dermatobacter hominis]
MGVFGRRRRSTDEGTAPTTVALAGAGAIAVVHALAAPAAGCQVVAVASAGGSSARHLAGQLDEQQAHRVRHVRIDELPAGADLLVVASPPATHAALVAQGLAGGADVLVEKPFTTTLADADELVGLAAEPGPLLRCAENLLHAPAWRAFAAHRSGMGPLQHLSARTLQPPPTWGHFTQPLEAGGVLFDLGPHALALVIGAAAEPVVGVAATLSSSRDDGADDDAVVRLRFASGLVASVDVSWTSPDTEWSLQAASPDGVARLELYPDVLVELDGEPVTLPDRHPSAPDPALERMGYVDQLRDTASAADGHPAPGQTPEQARDVLEVICAAYASAGSGGDEVALPFTGDRTRTPQQLWRG